MENKEKIIKEMFKKGILLSEDILEKELDQNLINKFEAETDIIVVNSDYVDVVSNQSSLVDWYEIDKYRVDVEKDRDEELYQAQLQEFKKSELVINSQNKNNEIIKQEINSLETELNVEGIDSNFSIDENLSIKEDEDNENKEILNSLDNEESQININNSVNIVISYENKPYKYTLKDFTNIFKSRYRFLEGILRNRSELQGILPINRILDKKDKEKVAIIGLVQEIGTTKNGHLIITLEDTTGKIKILISKNNKELFSEAKDLVFDEIVGISGVAGDKIIFAENIIWPDIPRNNDFKKSEIEEHAIFLSDIHVGSNVFLKKEFERFLEWLKGDKGNDKQKELAKKVKYIFIAGDLVDGIGIYPTQEEELDITNITDQYEEFTRYLQQIPEDKQIIICPGNHDMIHLAEPQPAFYEEYAPTLFKIPNVTLVTNPAIVNVGKTETFSGFDVLMYHGYSFDFYVSNVESIRNSGGYHRADLIMKFLLKRRHLAPSFSSTPYFPGHNEDPLLIKKIPDFFLTGHIHYSKVANYKGVTMISGSCWQGKTSFQEKLGHEPEPARVPVVNLKTREIKILKFI
jgi:DNA polymerase II small subunit